MALMQDPRKPKPEQSPLYDETLMDIFDFSPVSLQANRQGMLSQFQRQRLQADMQQEADGMWLLLTIMLGVTLLLALIMIGQGLPTLYLVIGAGIMIGAFMWLAYRRRARLQADMQRTRVTSVTGEAQVTGAGLMDDAHYRLQVGSEHFTLDHATARALMGYELPVLRVYYIPNSRTILSVEVAGQRKPVEEKTADDLEMETASQGLADAGGELTIESEASRPGEAAAEEDDSGRQTSARS